MLLLRFLALIAYNHPVIRPVVSVVSTHLGAPVCLQRPRHHAAVYLLSSTQVVVLLCLACSGGARGRVREGQLSPGARGRGRQKRVAEGWFQPRGRQVRHLPPGAGNPRAATACLHNTFSANNLIIRRRRFASVFRSV
jgi:hypothetical protein